MVEIKPVELFNGAFVPFQPYPKGFIKSLLVGLFRGILSDLALTIRLPLYQNEGKTQNLLLISLKTKPNQLPA